VRLIRFLFLATALAGGVWLGRRMLMRWIDGPAPQPWTGSWPPVSGDSGAAPTWGAPIAPSQQTVGVVTKKSAVTPAAGAARATTKKTAAPAAKAAATKKTAAPAAKAGATKKTPAPAAKAGATKKTAGAAAKKVAGLSAQKATAARRATVVAAAWVAPAKSGACPATHPVKAKLASRLYHLPGMAAYARTTPDRCYLSADAAETDGFTRAKR
jgi:hypothetical protein